MEKIDEKLKKELELLFNRYCVDSFLDRPDYEIAENVFSFITSMRKTKDTEEKGLTNKYLIQKANGGNSGYLVTTKKGITGRTYHKDDLINGKKPVYTEIDGKPVRLLCDPKTLTINGFID